MGYQSFAGVQHVVVQDTNKISSLQVIRQPSAKMADAPTRLIQWQEQYPPADPKANTRFLPWQMVAPETIANRVMFTMEAVAEWTSANMNTCVGCEHPVCRCKRKDHVFHAFHGGSKPQVKHAWPRYMFVNAMCGGKSLLAAMQALYFPFAKIKTANVLMADDRILILCPQQSQVEAIVSEGLGCWQSVCQPDNDRLQKCGLHQIAGVPLAALEELNSKVFLLNEKTENPWNDVRYRSAIIVIGTHAKHAKLLRKQRDTGKPYVGPSERFGLVIFDEGDRGTKFLEKDVKKGRKSNESWDWTHSHYNSAFMMLMSATKCQLYEDEKIYDVCRCAWGELLKRNLSCFIDIHILNWVGMAIGNRKLTHDSVLTGSDVSVLRGNPFLVTVYVEQALAKLYELRQRDRLPYVLVIDVPSKVEDLAGAIQEVCQKFTPCPLLRRSPMVKFVCSSAQDPQENKEAQDALQLALNADVFVMNESGKRGYSYDMVAVGLNLVAASVDTLSGHQQMQFYRHLFRTIKSEAKTTDALIRTVQATHGCDICKGKAQRGDFFAECIHSTSCAARVKHAVASMLSNLDKVVYENPDAPEDERRRKQQTVHMFELRVNTEHNMHHFDEMVQREGVGLVGQCKDAQSYETCEQEHQITAEAVRQQVAQQVNIEKNEANRKRAKQLLLLAQRLEQEEAAAVSASGALWACDGSRARDDSRARGEALEEAQLSAALTSTAVPPAVRTASAAAPSRPAAPADASGGGEEEEVEGGIVRTSEDPSTQRKRRLLKSSERSDDDEERGEGGSFQKRKKRIRVCRLQLSNEEEDDEKDQGGVRSRNFEVEEDEEEQEEEKEDHLLANQNVPSVPVSKLSSSLRPGRLSTPEHASSEGIAQVSKPPQGDLDVEEQDEQAVVLDRNALNRKQLREAVRADALQKRNQEAAARKARLAEIEAEAEQLRLQGTAAAAVAEEAEDQEIQDFVEKCKLSVMCVVKPLTGECCAALSGASKKPCANTRAKGKGTNGQHVIQFTMTKLVSSTQHWILGTDTEDDDDVSTGIWSNFQQVPNGGFKIDDNTVTPFVFYLPMPNSFKMYKRYAILADTEPAIKKNKHGFLSSEMYARMSEPTDVLDRTKIMSTIHGAGTGEKEGWAVVDAEKEKEAMIPEPDQMLQAKISKEVSEATKWNTICWHLISCKSVNDDVAKGALYIPFLLTLCDEVRSEIKPTNPRRLCRGWHLSYKDGWDTAMKLYLQHKHNDSQFNELWDKEVKEMSIMQIKKPNDCMRAAGILAAYPIGKMALDTLMAQVRKDLKSSPTPMAQRANLANPIKVINFDDDQYPLVHNTSEAPKRYVDDEECKLRLEDGNEPCRLKRDRSKWELEEENKASTDLDRQRIDKFRRLGLEKLKQCPIAAEGEESGIQLGKFSNQAQKSIYIAGFKYLLNSKVMTQVKHFPTYVTHNTQRTSTIGPNTYASVAKRLQDGGENASRAYHFSHTLRWVAQELAGGAQSFKDFDLNAFIVNLVKNPDDAILLSSSPDSNDLDDVAISRASSTLPGAGHNEDQVLRESRILEGMQGEAGRTQGSLKRKSYHSPPTVRKQKPQAPFGKTPSGRSRRRLFGDDDGEVAIDS